MGKIIELLSSGRVFWITLCVLISGCATRKDIDFIDIDSNEVESSFDVDRKTLDKFKVEKKNAPAPREKVFKKKSKKKSKSIPVPIVKKIEAEDIVRSLEDDVSTKGLAITYPAEYPEAYKKYDLKSKEVWPKFTPLIFPEEKFTFRVGYLGITAGFIKIETLPKVSIGGVEAFHFKARMRSARYYSYIYTLDDSLESFVSTDDFTPLKYVLLQRESAQTVDDLQLFDSQKLKTYHFYKRLKKGKKKNVELEKPIPRYFQDSYSALFFVRGLPLKKGDQYEFPIVTRGKIWILKLKIEGIDSLKIMDKWIPAIRINAETRFPGVLEKKGDIRFWYSNDKYRKLLKFQADVKIGSITGELVDYKPGK